MVNREHKTISISEQIFDQLERDILSGKYERGSVLSEQKLSEELGVSRTPIREALKGLVQEHILEEGSRGLVIIGISKQDVLDMYSIRIKIEGDCAALAARNISDDDIAKMEEAIDLQMFYIERQESTGSDNSDSIKNYDSRFHELMYYASGSAAYRDVLLSMHKKIVKFRKASLKKTGRAEKSASEHRAILEALKAHDEEKARELTTQHVKNAMESIKALEDV